MGGVNIPQEHGRLVARLKRQLAKCELLGTTPERSRKVRATVRELVGVERLRDMDDLARAGVLADPRRMAVLFAADDDTVLRRLALMAPGAGLEVVGRS